MKKFRSLTLDAKNQKAKKFKPSTRAEREFSKALRKVARASGHIVESHVDGVEIKNLKGMQEALKSYSKAIEPWAKRQAAKMLEQVQKSNKRAYSNKAESIGEKLQLNVAEQEVGSVAAALMHEQVALIKSLPIEAGLRAQNIALKAAFHGVRANETAESIEELTKQLGLTTQVTESRAKLIAITETARATASINQARAMAVGSAQYRWRNSGDEAVRKAHKYYKGKKLDGQIFSWDNPPKLDDGTKGHPGTFPRCRCFAEPVFDTE